MKTTRGIASVSLILALTLIPPSCGASKSPLTSHSANTIQQPATTTIQPTTTQPTQTANTIVQLTDGTNDLFDNDGKAITVSDAYLDITKVEILTVSDNYIFRMTLAGPIPASLDSAISIEWNFFLDTDRNPTTGWNYPIACNDIGPEYMISLSLDGSSLSPIVLNTITEKITLVVYSISQNQIQISFNSTIMPGVQSFDFVAAVRKWAKVGNSKVLVAADKTPGIGHVTYLSN